jgi:hypothetical protein
MLLLLLLCGCVLLGIHARTNSAKSLARQSRGAITVQAAGRGKPYLNFQDGRQMLVDYRGAENATRAMQSGQALARALASVDLDSNGTPDLVVGYAYNGGGIVTIQRGNPDAYAPKDDSVFVRMQQGYNPDSLLPGVDVLQVPEPVDFLCTGNFNHDSTKDILLAARGGGLYLLRGDGQGGLGTPEPISLPGVVTALTVGQFRAADGWSDVAVGVSGPAGPEVLVFDGAGGGFESDALRFPLTAEATAVEFGELDSDPFMDLAIASGSEIDAVHGWGRKTQANPSSRVERIALSFTAQSLAVDNFIWDRQGAREIAALASDGNVHLLERAGISKRAFSDQELAKRSAMRGQVTRKNEDVEAAQSWAPGSASSWNETGEIALNAGVRADAPAQGLLVHGKISWGETNALLVPDAAHNRVDIAHQVSTKEASLSSAARADDISNVGLNLADQPTAVLPLPVKLNGYRDVVVLSSGSTSPSIVPIVPAATVTVNSTPDVIHGGAGCSITGTGTCSPRDAVIFANANPGTAISINAGNYPLTIIGNTNTAGAGEGFSGDATIGDLDFRADNTTVTGAGAATTIIRQTTANDRTLEPNPAGDLNFDWTISGVTIGGGRDTGGSATGGGGAMLSGSKDNTTTITNCVIANNRATGAGTTGGGGISNQGGTVTITNTTFGGSTTVAACPSQADVTCGNNASSSGGGLGYSPGDPFSRTPSAGTLTVQTTTTFQNNTAGSISAGGGGADLYTHNLGTGSVSISSTTFTSNLATGASGGGIVVESIQTTVATSSFTSNTAAVFGGGIYTATGSVGPTLLLDGTSPSLTFTSNTATSGGGSVGANGPVTLAGANTTIGGDVAVLTSGTWTNNAGTTLNPTNLLILGGTFTCNNSTMNLSGNLSIGAEATHGGIFNANTGTVNIQGNLNVNLANGGSGAVGQFNAGTGLFNFNGSSAQSINGPSSPTFNNLTVNKGSNSTLTLNISSPIAGNLSVSAGVFDLLGNSANRTASGGTLTVSNGASLKIGGTNTLPSSFSTHSIGATSTIEYEGTTQTVAALNSSQNYGHLIISGSATKTLGGAITVVTDLTINGGTLDANSVSNFNIVMSGNWINNLTAANFTPRAATVTFNSTTGAQTIGGAATSQTFNNIIVNKSGQTLSVASSTTTLTLNGTMTISAGVFSAGTAANINIAGNWTNDVGPAAFTPGTGTVTFNSTTAGQSINGGAASQTFNNLTVSKTSQILNTGGGTTQLDLNGGFNLGAGTFTAPANTNVAGDWTEASGTTFTPGAGANKVTFNGTGARNLTGGAVTQTFNNLVFNKTGGGSVTGVSSTTGLTINGGVTLTAGTFSAGSITTIGIAGDWQNDAGTFTPGSSVVTFNSTTAAQTIKGTAATQTFNSITVNKSGQVLNVSGSTTTLNLNSTMNITAGNFNVNTAANVNVGGNWTLAASPGATFTAGGGTNTVTFNGSVAQNLNGGALAQTFNNLVVNKSNTLTVGGSTATLTINKDFTITAGTFAAGTALTINESGGNWSNTGSFTAGTGTVIFNANAVAQTLSGSTTFNNLTINHTGAGIVDASGSTLAVSGTLHVQSGTFTSASTFKDVTIDSGQTLNGTNATTMSVSGNWANSGTFTPNGNTVVFNAAGIAQTISGTNSFANLTINHTGANGVSSSGTLTVTGLLRVQSGSFTTATSLKDVQVNTGGTLIGTNATTMNVSGTWTIDTGGAFTPNTNTVNFNGSGAQTIGGTATTAAATTFNNLIIANAGSGVTLGQNETVNGVLTLTNDLNTSTFTLTQPSTAPASAGVGDVVGSIKRTALTSATQTYGNLNNTIGFTAGTPPTDITVKLTKTAPTDAATGQTNSGFSTAVNRTYVITPTGGSGFSATLQLHYQDGDLNSNNENTMTLWRYDAASGKWKTQGATSRDITNNWVQLTGVTQFSAWTFNSTFPTAANGNVAGQIVDSNGNPVEGAAVRMTGTQNRLTVTDAAGNYHFDDVETNGFYTVVPSRANFTFSPSQRAFSQLGQRTDAAFNATPTGGTLNPLDTTEYFVRQQYVDFLGREPDESGFNFWVNNIESCGADANCREVKRIDTSAAFFLSIEFQQTGYLVYRMYQAAYGDRPGAPVPIKLNEFLPDTRRLGQGLIVNQSGWQTLLANNQLSYAAEFVGRSRFQSAYPITMTPAEFVDQLFTNAGVTPGDSDRMAAINEFGTATTTSNLGARAAALRRVAENSMLAQQEFNQAFVLIEYFGYLQRDADTGPDTDFSGYNFWLDKLNAFGGNFQNAEMVKAFLVAGEYRGRFPR